MNMWDLLIGQQQITCLVLIGPRSKTEQEKKNKQFNITSITYNVFEEHTVPTYLVYDNVLSIKWFLLILFASSLKHRTNI